MKAAIYSPYLDSLGGGERYMLSVAKVLIETGWKVSIETQNPALIKKADERFSLGLGELHAVPSINRGDGYDLCIWLSDGSIPTLAARKNIIHIQRPFYDVDGKSPLNRMKFFRINEVIVNSQFTKKWTDKEYPKESKVIYPPVDVKSFKSAKKKENLILYVGRFSRLEQHKRQDVLVRAFKRFFQLASGNWKMVLAGGSDVGGREFVLELEESAHGFPIEIIENAPFNKIKELNSKAAVFWTAAGFEADQSKNPEKLEHFGMSLVEAMAAGAAPFAFAAGGHCEIINDGTNGHLWVTIEELVEQTYRAVTTATLPRLARQAQADADYYSYDRFKKEFIYLL